MQLMHGTKNCAAIFGQMPLASDPRTGHVSIIDMRNSLNIHFTGIHALANLFSVIFHKKRDQNEISRQTLNFHLSMEPILELPLHSEVQHLCRSRCGRLLLHHISLTHGVHKHPDRYQRTIKPLIP